MELYAGDNNDLHEDMEESDGSDEETDCNNTEENTD